MRCHILENNLIEALGHYLNATAGLKREFERRRVKAFVYTHRQASPDVIAKVRGRPAFGHCSWEGNDETDAIGVMDRIGAGFARSCEAIDNPRADDFVLVTTAQFAQAYGLALYLESLPPERRPRAIVHVHWASWDDKDRRSAWRIAARRLLAATGEGRAVFAAPTDQLASSLAQIIGHPVERVPLPQDYGEDPHIAPKVPPKNPMVVVLGRSLPRKGSGMLPVIIFLARLIAPKLCFFVQITNDLRNVQLLRAVPGIHIHKGAIDAEDYLRRVAAADIILLPYRRQDYIGRTSGIFAECAALGRVAVIPSGTWMSDQIEKKRASGVAYADDRIFSILRALLHAARTLPELSRDARARAHYWWQHESVSAFADRILALAAPGAGQIAAPEPPPAQRRLEERKSR